MRSFTDAAEKATSNVDRLVTAHNVGAYASAQFVLYYMQRQARLDAARARKAADATAAGAAADADLKAACTIFSALKVISGGCDNG